MKKILLCLLAAAWLASCNSEKDKTAGEADAKTGGETASSATPADLPYTALYSSDFTEDVSDADLKMVLMSYKDWETGNMTGLGNVMADSVQLDGNDGRSRKMTNADLMKEWSMYRDSLSSINIRMHAWQKMYAADKKEPHVVVWYTEIDTYKDGRVDSADYHDINGIKDGKINWYSSYKRGYKK